MQHINIEPLDVGSFEPFGQVIAHNGLAGRCYFDSVFEQSSAARTRLWINRQDTAVTLPYRICSLERHPASAQTFLPLTGTDYLAIVCHATADGCPDLPTLRAFRILAPTGITYHRNTWHHGLLVLQHPSNFAVIMGEINSERRESGNDVFYALPEPGAVICEHVSEYSDQHRDDHKGEQYDKVDGANHGA